MLNAMELGVNAHLTYKGTPATTAEAVIQARIHANATITQTTVLLREQSQTEPVITEAGNAEAKDVHFQQEV